MKAMINFIPGGRLSVVLGILLAVMFTACSKEEVSAPSGHSFILKGGDGLGNDQGRISGPSNISVASEGKQELEDPSVNSRDFDEDGSGEDGISDDGDDEGDNEKSNKKPRTN
ncbi:MAG: hypothetical protein IPG74_13880 [Flavobacteriales bacterium]|mgnify:CR=1 FL=1|nr:hypothetical protein [Flavobacteriales bacterium]MBK7555788.1 hypothetical protein [Flavobacteriales bacterium]MBK9195772.1 hypothetical protein [Flavobacteriales bacterium]MBP6572941.1 hypothetical protein [Flavobacteriales bacterium]